MDGWIHILVDDGMDGMDDGSIELIHCGFKWIDCEACRQWRRTALFACLIRKKAYRLGPSARMLSSNHSMHSIGSKVMDYSKLGCGRSPRSRGTHIYTRVQSRAQACVRTCTCEMARLRPGARARMRPSGGAPPIRPLLAYQCQMQSSEKEDGKQVEIAFIYVMQRSVRIIEGS